AQAAHPPPFVRRYDLAYYAGWAERACDLAGPGRERLPWMHVLRQRASGWAAALLAAPLTVIHGEYYPHNVLVRGGEVYALDWESAAVGAGEIDLATLTEGWPVETVRQCEQAYRRARWPGGPPADFEQRLAAARLYLAFRWL